MKYTGPTPGGILGLPPAVSNIVLFTGVIYLLQMLLPNELVYIPPSGMPSGGIPAGLALIPRQVLTRGMVWELFTYMFLHASFTHILFNMLALVVFGRQLEWHWGSRNFAKYYFITGIGAGVIHVITTYMFGFNPNAPTVGASGAIFGILIAYAMAFPDHKVYLYFLVPVSARTLVTFFIILQIVLLFENGPRDNVARFAHLGGALVGYLYLKQDLIVWKLRRWLGRIQATTATRGKPRGPSGNLNPETKAKIDEILEKISREGMGSLTAEERKILHDAGSRARERQQGRD